MALSVQNKNNKSKKKQRSNQMNIKSFNYYNQINRKQMVVKIIINKAFYFVING